jgi:ABC-type transporter Mla MlaB component
LPDGHPCLNGRRPSEAQSPGAGGAVVEVRFADAVTTRTAFALCQSIRSHLADSPRTLVLNLEEVKAVDVVGLAALLQMARLARQLGVPFAIIPSVAIHRGLISAELVEEVPVVSDPGQAPLSAAGARDLSPPDALTPFLAATPRLGLRQPAWEELSIFADWANDSLLQEMVGSEFLYRCRHLGPYHPDFVASIFSDPTSLTLLVQPVSPPASPVGFVRLYNIYGRLAPDSTARQLEASRRRRHPGRVVLGGPDAPRVRPRRPPCPRCGGGLHVIATIPDPLAGHAILASLALPGGPAPPAPAAIP